MNELQLNTLKKLKEYLPGASYIDIQIRTGGKTYVFEADFLKDIILNLKETHESICID